MIMLSGVDSSDHAIKGGYNICDVVWENPSHVAKGNCKIKEINIIIMFFLVFCSL